jgi:trigger factor
VVELGRGSVVDEIDQGLVGMAAGDTREIEFELADGTTQTVVLTLKEIKEKVLPPLDDELARAASEFETLAELRAEIEGRLREQIEEEIETQFRSDVADALVGASKVDASGPLVESRTRELLRGLARQVEARGIQFETYLTMTGQSPDQLLERLRAEATTAVARELVLEAAADQLGIEVTDAEIEEWLRERFEDADEAIAELKETELWERDRESLRLRKALDRIASEVKRIPRELAAAREAIWTPDKEKPQTETKLWTPGSRGAT